MDAREKCTRLKRTGSNPTLSALARDLATAFPSALLSVGATVCDPMGYGATSDTWSANPLSSAAVLATLDEFETTDVIARTQHLSKIFADGLRRLKQTGLIVNVRGEGMVFGIECGPHGSLTPNQVANAIVERCYRGDHQNDGIHLLGPPRKLRHSNQSADVHD